jgi:hypothetical protein
MSRTRYWLCAAIPLVIALTKAVGAEGLAAEPVGGAATQAAHVSLDATDVTLDALARLMSESLGCEVRIEGVAMGTVSVNLKDVTTAALLAQTAQTLGAKWQVLYRLSTKEPAAAPPVASGLLLKLNLSDVSCQAAASVVARMAGGKLERDGELSGQVSLAGGAMPVEEAMDKIASAAKASWRRIYVIHVDQLPTTSATGTSQNGDANDPEKSRKPKPKPGPQPWSSHPSATGQPTKFARRDRKAQKTYAKGIRPVQPTLEEIEKHAMMGLYGTFFLLDSEGARETAMKNFQAGLDLQLHRLEALPASQRRITTMMTRTNFQRLIDDFANLSDDQKKEAQKLYDYAKAQLERPVLKQQ